VANVAERYDDERYEARDPVLHRTRGSTGDARFAMLVVNLSPGGLMARCDAVLAPGDVVRLDLPIVGSVAMRVRWALAGRVGCQFDAALSPLTYGRLLPLVAA